MYFIQKSLTKFHNTHSTGFLDPKELKEVQSQLKKKDYLIYYPYPDSEKNILYSGEIPEVLLYEIKSKIPLRHQDILGTLYSLNIASEYFGDVLLIENHYYVYIHPFIRNYFEANFLKVRNSSVEVEEIPLSTLENYERNYESLELIVSSNRIDTIVSSICHTSRSMIQEMLSKKEIFLNYEILKDGSVKLREGNTFSIKRIGKFKYVGILKNTKSNHLIVEIKQYK